MLASTLLSCSILPPGCSRLRRGCAATLGVSSTRSTSCLGYPEYSHGSVRSWKAVTSQVWFICSIASGGISVSTLSRRRLGGEVHDVHVGAISHIGGEATEDVGTLVTHVGFHLLDQRIRPLPIKDASLHHWDEAGLV